MIIIDGSQPASQPKYNPITTAKKAAPPFLMILIVQAAAAAAKAAAIEIDDKTLYSIALAGYGGLVAFINWLKNRKKGK
jgi:hypothetical protein